MNGRIDVIELLREENPVRSGAPMDVPTFDEFFASLFERSDAMSQATPAGKRSRWLPILGGAIAVVAVGLALAFALAGSGTEWNDTPAEQRAVIEQVIQAVNDRDAAGFAEPFSDEATFIATTFMEFVDRDEIVPRRDQDLVEAMMAVHEAWGIENVLEACEPQSESSVRCGARQLMHVARTEMVSEWLFVFGGEQLNSGGFGYSDLDPGDGTMALSWVDLTGAMQATGSRSTWLAWAEENDPDLVRRMEGHVPEINGIAFGSHIFMGMDPSMAQEVGESVDRYLEELESAGGT